MKFLAQTPQFLLFISNSIADYSAESTSARLPLSKLLHTFQYFHKGDWLLRFFSSDICSHIPAFLGSTSTHLFITFCDVNSGSQELKSGHWQILWLKFTWISGIDFSV